MPAQHKFNCTTHLSCFNFILCSNFYFPFFKLNIIHYHTQKQKEKDLKRELNYNTFRCSALPDGLLAQLVERCTGIAEVIGFESRASLIFFRLCFYKCISCVYNCDDLLSI